MTIKELKEKIMTLDDNMRVGGSGYFGEFLDCNFVSVTEVDKEYLGEEKETILCIYIEHPGDEPD